MLNTTAISEAQSRTAIPDQEVHQPTVHFIRWQTRHNRVPDLIQFVHLSDDPPAPPAVSQILHQNPNNGQWEPSPDHQTRHHRACPACRLQVPTCRQPHEANRKAAIPHYPELYRDS